MRNSERIKDLEIVKERLKECKPEWLEKNARGQDSLGIWAVQQILDNAVKGITTWDFVILEQWREEVYKYDKNSRQWVFDGYVYHVRGCLHIEGIGSRQQFGSKVAVGGKDNQASSYKAAASDCLKKCASLFGVGSSIYSKIQIDMDDDVSYGYDNSQQAYQNQYVQSQQQYAQQQQPQQVVLPNGDIQQGEWIWTNGNWVHQSKYYVNQQPQQQAFQQPTTGYVNDFNSMKDVNQSIQESVNYANQAVTDGTIDFPFENVPEQKSFEATPGQGAEAKPGAVKQNFKAIEYGAPVVEGGQSDTKKHEDPLANIEVNNPWGTPEVLKELNVFQEHKKRLNISSDQELLPHVRDFFKNEDAKISDITPDNLKDFNAYLTGIQA